MRSVRSARLAVRSPSFASFATCAALALVAASGCGSSEDEPGASAGATGASAASTAATGAGGAGGGGTGGGGAGGEDGLVVATDSGPVRGALVDGVRAFRGIPFAAPPVGERRWQAPEPPAPWTEPLDATEPGAKCPQADLLTGVFDETASEDCLTLEVWTPAGAAPGDARPVMVWLHGGGFVSGAGSLPTYAGDDLAKRQGVVIVNVNYRLGPLGFLSHPSLDGEDPKHPVSGNFGLMDQRLALEWVQRNAEAFGGDPGNVTLFGESAGAISVCAHLASPESGHLFHRAIMESGLCESALDAESAYALGGDLAAAVGCAADADVAACLRKKTAKELVMALPTPEGLVFGEGPRWGPSIDGEVLPMAPSVALASGKHNAVPLLLGSNRDEGTLFLFLAGFGALREEEYEAIVTGLSVKQGVDPEVVLAQYPASEYESPKAALAALVGESVFNCPARRAARAVTTTGQSAYLYHFTRALEQPGLPGDLGAFHSAEIPFVFGNTLFTAGITEEDRPLSDAMMGYWTRFAETGDPNGDGAVAWPAYDAETDPHLGLDLTIEAGTKLREENCDFWDAQL